MTKLAILSDIHGNLPALEAVISDFENFDVDPVIVPGDVINFGPFPNQAAKLVIEKGGSVLHGNGEPISEALLDEYLTNANWWEFAHPAYHVNME